ncbi:MAG: hypothetical protein KJZ78_13370 [Bryobacteraceae bacterium]|nr:hypothetical protein [Bryobacteraceae bacterium]
MRFFAPLVLLIAAQVFALDAAGRMERLQIGGEWCFIRHPARNLHAGEAIVLLHGNGHTVESTTSTWEQQRSLRGLMDRLSAAGYLIAQSNHTATRSNGMWGNPESCRSVLALMRHLENGGVRRFHAISNSAGNLVLLNLLLSGQTRFESAAAIAGVVSLESMYRCPTGADRVTGIAEAFAFNPASRCPGNPDSDTSFRNVTADYDPLRRMQSMNDGEIRRLLGSTRWLGLYETRDPKVLPEENILSFARRLKTAGVAVELRSLDLATHGAGELFDSFTPEILRVLRGSRGENSAQARIFIPIPIFDSAYWVSRR